MHKLIVLLTALCWLVMDNFWRLKARNTQSVATIAHVPMWRKLWLVLRSYGFYYLPLSAVPVLGLRIIPEQLAWAWVGLAMCICGVGFAIWSRHVLAKNWNVATGLEDHHALIQSGPYAIVRHPIYFGIWLVMLGTAPGGRRIESVYQFDYLRIGRLGKIESGRSCFAKGVP
ncbi:MAG: methyltransferase [Verrucomicrobiota bacterium]